MRHGPGLGQRTEQGHVQSRNASKDGLAAQRMRMHGTVWNSSPGQKTVNYDDFCVGSTPTPSGPSNVGKRLFSKRNVSNCLGR